MYFYVVRPSLVLGFGSLVLARSELASNAFEGPVFLVSFSSPLPGLIRQSETWLSGYTPL